MNGDFRTTVLLWRSSFLHKIQICHTRLLLLLLLRLARMSNAFDLVRVRITTNNNSTPIVSNIIIIIHLVS